MKEMAIRQVTIQIGALCLMVVGEGARRGMILDSRYRLLLKETCTEYYLFNIVISHLRTVVQLYSICQNVLVSTIPSGKEALCGREP